MEKKLTKEQEEAIFGSSMDYVSKADLLDRTFTVRSYKLEDVEGYKTPSAVIQIVLDGEETSYSTFSAVIQEQLAAMVKSKALPLEVKLVEIASKKRKNATILKFVAV